jgi:hypothetical protein
MSTLFNPVVYQGADNIFGLTLLKSEDATPINLTDCTLKGQIKKSYDTSVLTSFTISIENAVSGKAQMSLDPIKTDLLVGAPSFVYDVVLTKNGEKTRVLQGTINVDSGVTRS